jgi:hypothetical protein
MKLVSPEDLGFRESKLLKCQKLSMQALSNFSMLVDALERVAPIEKKMKKSLQVHHNELCILQTP